MKIFKWNLLLAALLFSSISLLAQSSGSGIFFDCFSMNPTVNERKGFSQICIDIEVDVHVDLREDVVLVTDNYGNSIECASDCSFTWCYPDPSPLQMAVDINCSVGGPVGPGEPDPVCSQDEGCIVVIGPGGPGGG